MPRAIEAGGRRAVTVGLQVFNLFNRTNFDLPEHLADEPTTSGRIFSAKAPLPGFRQIRGYRACIFRQRYGDRAGDPSTEAVSFS